MNKRILSVLISLFLFCLLLTSSRQVYASTIFEDDFNSYNDGDFPSKWTTFNTGEPACPGQPWSVSSGHLKAYIVNGGCVNNLVPNDVNWPNPVANYIFESDITFLSGIDHNIGFRIQNGVVNEVHFIVPGNDFSFGAPPGIINVSTILFYNFNTTYHFKAIINDKNLKIFINNILVRDIDLDNELPPGKIDLRIGSGSGGTTETWFDNVKVTTLDEQSSNDLAVPLLKQTDPLWGSNLYDSANLWSTGSTDISRWGCAITSAAMVLQFNKITKLPNGQDLTPGTLNAYLLTTPDGYKPNGVTNWHAISVMTKKAKVNNPNFAFHALEDDYRGANDTAAVEGDLNNNMSDILQVNTGSGMHFVVAKGKNGSVFNINDPFFDRSDLSSYGNTFASVKRFVPTNTDLSFLMFLVDPSTDIVLKDEQENIIGQSSIEVPIGDPLNLLSNTAGPLRQIIFSEPPAGNYKIDVSSTNPTSYTLHGYLYDIDGNVKMFEQKDVLTQNDNDNYTINFNKDRSADINIEQNVTLGTLNNDVVALYSLGHLKKEFYKELLEKIKEVEKNQNRKGDGLYHKLRELRKEIGKKKGVDTYASEILMKDIQLLIDSLPASSHEDD